LVGTLCLLVPSVAMGQEGPTAQPLWKAYPLDPKSEQKAAPPAVTAPAGGRLREQSPAASGAGRERSPARSGAGGGEAQPGTTQTGDAIARPHREAVGFAVIVLVLAALAIVALVVVVWPLRRTRRRLEPVVVEPTAAPAERPSRLEPVVVEPTAAPAARPSSADRRARAPAIGPSDDGPPGRATDKPTAQEAVSRATSAMLALTHGRRARGSGAGNPITPIAQDLYLEGCSRDPEIGEFGGQAVAAAVVEKATTMYLVDDMTKEAPVWVRAADVQRLPSGRPADDTAPGGTTVGGPADDQPHERMVRADQAAVEAAVMAGAADGRRSPTRLAPGTPMIGYVTVSGDSRSGEPDASSSAIEAACERSGWRLLEIVSDDETAERPGFDDVLERIANAQARGLVVSELLRLSRSIADLGRVMAWFRDAHATLVALDLGVDTSTPEGHHAATTLITVSGWERERGVERTRTSMAEVRAKRRPTGPPAVSDNPELLERIAEMRAANMSLQAIADQLNAEGIPTPRGGKKWRPSSLQAALGYRRPGTGSQLPPPQKRGRS
jgi:DNA invertase Pin-like site-specific DNA recombinase